VVDYSPFMVESKDEALVKDERMEMRPGMDLIAFPPLIFIGSASVSWFVFLCLLFTRTPWGVFI
jgi:hypothetical protein